MRPNHEHWTTVGEGSAIVECQFNVSSEGDIEDLIVEYQNINILPCLTEDQVEDLCVECFDAYVKEAEESNADAQIAAYEDRWAA